MSYFRPDQIKKITSIKFENVSAKDDEGKDLLKNITLDFPIGRMIQLKGDYTRAAVLKALAGLLPTSSGRILLNGEDLVQMSFEALLPYRLNTGYSFAYGGLMSNRTLRDNLLLPFQYHGVPQKVSEEIVNVGINEFGLERFKNIRPASVPGSVRKLACVLRALLLRPQVLIMDDPTGAIGLENLQVVKKWLRSRKEDCPGFTVIVASDDLDLVGEFSPEILIFSDGAHVAPPVAEVGVA